MGLIASLPEIDTQPDSVFMMHEKSEKLIPLHAHSKGQLSYVEGGIAYVTIDNKTYVIPARHYFWIPKGIWHVVKVGQFATVFRSLYFYGTDDAKDEFYGKMDEVMGELKTIREEVTVLGHQVSDHDDRIEKIESHLGMTSD